MNIGDMLLIEEEQNRINAGTAQGEQSIMVQSDMKQWGVENGMWPNIAYWKIVYDHAEARGWTQEGFTGMEIIE